MIPRHLQYIKRLIEIVWFKHLCLSVRYSEFWFLKLALLARNWLGASLIFSLKDVTRLYVWTTKLIGFILILKLWTLLSRLYPIMLRCWLRFITSLWPRSYVYYWWMYWVCFWHDFLDFILRLFWILACRFRVLSDRWILIDCGMIRIIRLLILWRGNFNASLSETGFWWSHLLDHYCLSNIHVLDL